MSRLSVIDSHSAMTPPAPARSASTRSSARGTRDPDPAAARARPACRDSSSSAIFVAVLALDGVRRVVPCERHVVLGVVDDRHELLALQPQIDAACRSAPRVEHARTAARPPVACRRRRSGAAANTIVERRAGNEDRAAPVVHHRGRHLDARRRARRLCPSARCTIAAGQHAVGRRPRRRREVEREEPVRRRRARARCAARSPSRRSSSRPAFPAATIPRR